MFFSDGAATQFKQKFTMGGMMSDCVDIPGTHKMLCVKVLFPYVIETKEHCYLIEASSQHNSKFQYDTPDSSAVDHQYQKN